MKKLIFIFALAFLLNNCVQTPDPEIPKRVSYQYRVDNVGNTIYAGSDSLKVNEIKLLAEKFDLAYVSNGGGTIQTRADGLVMAYSQNMQGDENLVLGTNIGYEDINGFNRMKLYVNPPSNSDNLQDSDFFGGSDNYSIVIRGMYNKDSFEYKSDASFDRVFDFSRIDLSKSKHTLALLVMQDIKDILLDESGAIIKPDQSNKSKIDSLLEHSIELESYSTDVIRYQ